MMSREYLIGIDIGGTKCALTLAKRNAGDRPVILQKAQFPTGQNAPQTVLARFARELDRMLEGHGFGYGDIRSMGISCGGPLDSQQGIILSPPNLPGWDRIAVCDYFTRLTGAPCRLQNDANACAVAEWRYGAGKGVRNMVFLTFGTGLGAGLILNGSLYCGSRDNAGEIGHVRLAPRGPTGFGKQGSCEGFCSGGGLAQLGIAAMRNGAADSALAQACQGDASRVTAQLITELARAGDSDCVAVCRQCGQMLGRTIAIVCDLLDPDIIVIGGIYMRAADVLKPHMQEELFREALSPCPVVSASLGEQVGDYAALSVAEM